ncbi:hypothetical protein BDY21DRAFT_338138 [Lineolata rhizophorae]|uniref:THUMP domain-containing protein n=1 Tax=Lineolata rhizophorae TaxID=578093 RepID=A0A6A6P6G4_9PEZI|nr:hypothetical protein BDY21DRAFT_338138 [Lineolata rhizophorae]
MSSEQKRKASSLGAADQQPAKKKRGKKQWRTPRQNTSAAPATNNVPTISHDGIEPGDAGIFVTCDRSNKAKCTAELKDLFEDFAEKLYGVGHGALGAGDGASASADDTADREAEDIEASIRREVQSIKKPTEEPLFRPVKLSVDCVVFFRTRPPIEPVGFVHAICSHAAKDAERKLGRYIKRLTPMTRFEKTTDKGLAEVAQQVLAPHFHEPGAASKKFAIRPSFRNHNTLTREAVIKQVAAAVGAGHKVNLTDYDALILVEVYKNVCGMSVVGKYYDQLKRFNLAEIYRWT